MQLSENIWNILICPNCGKSLRKDAQGAFCSGCNTEYYQSDLGILDLRLTKIKSCMLEFEIGDSKFSTEDLACDSMNRHPKPEVDFSGINIPNHLSQDILSYFPRASSSNSLMLDLGCGSATHQSVCEQAGFEWVGLDYDSQKALLFGDAHALPFSDESFEFILSIAVLEHIRYPFVMMQEAYRVLKPGGKFIGTVAFLEPFHGQSYYHHTHLGTFNSLQFGGFRVDKLSYNDGWTVLKAQADMVLFPGMPASLAQALIGPINLTHKLWWSLINKITGKQSEHIRLRDTAGSFCFIATKERAL